MLRDTDNRYLNRLQIDQDTTPSYSLLARLQVAHLVTVPFENLSVIRQERIVLDEPLLVDKIVQRRRGGFCYELNGAFSWLLRQLGFTVTRISARVYNSTSGEFGPEFDHMALIVHLDQDYLVDVGFGDSVRQPLALPAGTAEDVSGRYRILPVDTSAAGYHLQRQVDGVWQAQYAFTTQPRQLTEYAPMCDYHQYSPQSHFTQRAVCTIATATGRLSLSPDALTITENGEKRKRPVTSPEEYQRLLQRYFGLNAL
jgi:N-hydroxyarylamine O-acetyltransferase